uniref:ABC transporter ATP-binding protein n=1 Tax=Flavobacterium sp. TaxID=239 RepID=UPI00404B034E
MKAFDLALFKRILTYTKPFQLIFRGVIVWAVLLSVFAALRPYLLKQTVDLYVQANDAQGLLFYIILMAVVLGFEVLSQFYFVFWANKLGQDIVKSIRLELFNKLLQFRMKYFDNASVGQLVTRSVSDLEAIARIFSQGLFMIISDLLKMIVVLVLMFYMNWKLSWIVIAAMPVLLYATRVFQIKMKSAFEEVRTQISNLNTFVQERLSGVRIVQLFSREAIEYEKFKAINHKHKTAWIKTVWYNSIFFPIADTISSVTLGVIVWHGGLQIIGGDSFTTTGDLFAYTMYIAMLFNPLRQIADKFNELQMGMIAARRVFGVLDESEPIQKDGQNEAPNFEGNIEFKDVYFGYKPDEMVLKGINLSIKAGETIAIVGSTGAGKSTIINLLNRFYDIQKGAITIDGLSIETLNLASLRKQIAVVLQDVFLFADTIHNNITLKDPNISREDVVQAAKKIGVDEFIMTLPNGYDYNVKERGVMLSSGQRQLIAFLRAYVSNPSILILDEATSSIDTYSEQLIQNATEKITQNRTSIIIAHRLATVAKAAMIIVMNQGKIVESGNHLSLLAKQDGYYKKLYDSQFSEVKTIED